MGFEIFGIFGIFRIILALASKVVAVADFVQNSRTGYFDSSSNLIGLGTFGQNN